MSDFRIRYIFEIIVVARVLFRRDVLHQWAPQHGVDCSSRLGELDFTKELVLSLHVMIMDLATVITLSLGQIKLLLVILNWISKNVV